MNEQDKREKVIKELERCVLPHGRGCTPECEYHGRIECCRQVMRKAITLLKAQEPVSPMQTNGHTGSPIWICGNCKSWIGSKIVSYCWHCGRAVKWE